MINTYIKNKPDNEALFSNIQAHTRLSRISAYRILCQACAEAGINCNVGTHTLRKTFGYHFYNKFKDIAMLQKVLNHSNPAITLRYIGIEQEEIYECFLNFNL